MSLEAATNKRTLTSEFKANVLWREKNQMLDDFSSLIDRRMKTTQNLIETFDVYCSANFKLPKALKLISLFPVDLRGF